MDAYGDSYRSTENLKAARRHGLLPYARRRPQN